MSGAAFVDADGTLVGTNIVRVSLFLARRAAGLGGRAGFLGRVLSGLPRLALAEARGERGRVNEIHYASYRGVSEDRLQSLADELFEEVVRPAILPGAREFVAEHRTRGVRPVLVTGALDFVVRPLARTLGIEDVAANSLLFAHGVATGALRRPILAGAAKAAWVRGYAQRNALDLAHCFAFADDVADVPLLSVVGHPVALNPTPALARLAREQHWPVARLRAPERRDHA